MPLSPAHPPDSGESWSASSSGTGNDRPGDGPPARSARVPGRRAARRDASYDGRRPGRPGLPPGPLGACPGHAGRRRPARQQRRPGQLRRARRPGPRSDPPDHRDQPHRPDRPEPEGRSAHEGPRSRPDPPDLLGPGLRRDRGFRRLRREQARGQRPGEEPAIRARRDGRTGLGGLSRPDRERILGSRGSGAEKPPSWPGREPTERVVRRDRPGA